MAENLVSRVKRLVSGGVNSLVDSIENATPETVMTEAIREVDAAVDQVRNELSALIANKHLASTRLAEATSKHEDLKGKIALAVSEGRDDLAEAAIARQLDLEVQVPVLEAAVADAAREEQELEGYVEALHARKREMEEELKAYQDSRKQSSSDAAEQGAAAANGTVENRTRKAEEAFDRVMKSTTGIGSGSSGDLSSSAKLAELEQMARKNRIAERLAAVKAAAKD